MRSQQSLSEGSWVNGSIITLWPRVSEQAKKMLCPWMVQGRCSEVVAPSVAQNEHDYIYISFHKEPMSKIHNSGDIGHISQCVSDQDLAGHKLHPFLSTSIFHGIMYLIRYTYIYTVLSYTDHTVRLFFWNTTPGNGVSPAGALSMLKPASCWNHWRLNWYLSRESPKV